MTIEADAAIPQDVLDELRGFDWVRWARSIEKIA
jgi:hypothetical protein